jgi:hypothetical protein
MATWTPDELDRIGGAEELTLACVREDGTVRAPVRMWVVRIGDEIYVRSVNGRGSSWFRGVQARHEARMASGGVERDVEVVETDEANDAVDAAYVEKYGRRYKAIVPSLLTLQARAATVRLEPR